MTEQTSSYQDLTVWQLAMDLVVDCYKLVKQFPSVDRYGLETQLLKSAMDIPTSIAEAHARCSSSIYLENIATALGTLAQLETQVLIAERLYYCNAEQRNSFIEKMNSIKWLLIRLRKSFIRPSVNRELPSNVTGT